MILLPMKNPLILLPFFLVASTAVASPEKAPSEEKSATTSAEVTQPKDLAPWDLSAGFQSRTMPMGATFYAVGGYNFLLWKADADLNPANPSGSRDWRYGYIRPTVKLSSIGVVNSISASVDVHPISILGVSVGTSGSWRVVPAGTSYVDCNTVYCDGTITRNFVAAKAVLGSGRLFFGGTARFEWMSAGRADQPFLDENATLVGTAGSDRFASFTGAVGFLPGDKQTVGLMFTNGSFLGSGQRVQSAFGFYQFAWNDFRPTIGAGYTEGTTFGSNFLGVLQVEYVIRPSFAIF